MDNPMKTAIMEVAPQIISFVDILTHGAIDRTNPTDVQFMKKIYLTGLREALIAGFQGAIQNLEGVE